MSFISESKHRRRCRLQFICSGQSDHCLYSHSFFPIQTKNPRIWIHIMFLAIQVYIKGKKQKYRRSPELRSSTVKTKGSSFHVNRSQKTSEISGIRTHAFSVKGKQPRQHGMVGLALLPTRPARLLMEAAIMGILNFVVNTQQLMQRKVLMVLLYIE